MTNSNLDTLLKKHFSPDGLEQSCEPIQKALRMLRQWMAAERGGVYPTADFSGLMDTFNEYAIPAEGMEVETFLDRFSDTVLPNTAQLNHPMYIGHMTQALPWFSIIIEALTAALNQNQVKVETAYVSTLIEKQILGWLHRMVYCRDDAYYADAMKVSDGALGNLVSGGTMGNLTALAVALEQQLPGTRKEGVHATLARSGYRGLAVVASARVHYSLKKAMATLGLGENALHVVPVDRNNRIDLDALDTKIDELTRERIKIVAIVGIGGTTETGAIDPLREMAEIARSAQAWFHVDAAWGGALLLVDQFKSLYNGIELADSVVIDGHKLFWVPMAQGTVLFRESSSLNCLKHHANYIIRENSGDLGQRSLEGSRRFDALKLWATFKIFGLKGYAQMLQQASKLTDQMRNLLKDQQDFELISDSETFILTYRYIPQHLKQRLASLVESGATNEAIGINRKLNLLNASLQQLQKEGGKSFVSRTVLESSAYPGEITVLRVVLSNLRTAPNHLRAILAEQRLLGSALVEEFGLN